MMIRTFRVPLAIVSVILADGDSLNVNGDWPGQFAVLRPQMTKVFIGRAGSLATEAINEFQAQAAPYTPPRYVVTYAIWTAANDVANNQGSADTIYLRLRKLWKLARDCNYTVAAFTITKGAGIVGNGRETVRTDLNTLIRAATAHYDYLIDVDEMFVALAGADYYLDTDYFNADGIHLSNGGAAEVAALVDATFP